MNKTTLVFLLLIVVAAGLFLTGAAECTPTPGGGGGASGGSSSIGSIDPNEISGPLGFGEKRIVQRGDRLDYVIYFENKQEATAAAYLVKVTLPQDPNLDWTTLRLGEVVVSSHADLGLVNKASGSSMLPMSGTPGWSMKTDVVQSGGNLEWTMRLWDPATIDHYPDDPTAGILPPNDPATHIGEGHVSFSVSVKSDAADGAVARAAATIVFDTNDPITTDPSWWNTVGELRQLTLDLGDGTTTNLTLVVGQPFGELPVPGAREGYDFVGWFTQPNGEGRQITADSLVEAGDEALYQYWRKSGDPEPRVTPAVFDSFVAGSVGEKGATYNGFLGEETFGGTFTLVVKKPKKGQTTASATLTRVDPTTGKKEKVTGTVDVTTGVCAGNLAGLLLNEKGVGGKLGELSAQGAVDAAKAKDQTTLDLMNGFDKSVYSVALTNANGSCTLLTATFSKKGKVKVAGTVGGVKISCSAQMSVGDRYAAVPFAYAKPKKEIRVSGVLWFEKETKKLVDVTGVGAGVVPTAFGDASAPDSGEYRFLMAEADVLASVPNAISNTAYEVKATFDGKKYDAGKAAKVKYDRKTSTLTVDPSKGTDVSGLKLKYAKGAISGSFTVYEVDAAKGKLVKNKFTVNGVIVDGIGYGLATNKKLKPIPVALAK